MFQSPGPVPFPIESAESRRAEPSSAEGNLSHPSFMPVSLGARWAEHCPASKIDRAGAPLARA
jgi:hypothetical protein